MLDVGIDGSDELGANHLDELGAKVLEEGIVELHDGWQRSPVGGERGGIVVVRPCFKIVDLGVQEVPVATTPAVDALLDITDDKVLIALCKGVAEQGLEVAPLHARGVLEFVDHVRMDACARLFVDEGCIVLVDKSRKHLGGGTQQHDVLLVAVGSHFLVDVGEDAQFVEVALDNAGGEVVLIGVARGQGDALLHHLLECILDVLWNILVL